MNELEVIKRIKNDFEYWSARELMKALGYEKWQKFEEVVRKAMSACTESKNDVTGHFIASAKRKVVDYLLTRYACYLIAQNGDSRKPEIASI